MKKKISLAIGGVVAAGVLSFGIFYSSGPQSTAILSADEISEKVTSEYPGEITEIEKETELNHAIYEVKLSNEGKVYHLKIDGSTAEILEIKEKSTSEPSEEVVPEENEPEDESDELSIEEKTEKDIDKEASEDRKNDEHYKGHHDHEDHEKHKKNKHRRGHKDNYSKKEKGKHSSMHTVISVEEAKKIALKAFPGEIDDIDLDKEDGRLVYEIEIEREDQEAEILIDAYTGEIIIMEIDED